MNRIAALLRPARCLLASCVLVALAVGAPASAQDGGLESCDEPPLRRPQEVFPADSAVAVSLDSPLRVRYSPDYFVPGGPGGDPTVLLSVQSCPGAGCDLASCADPGAPISGRVQVLGDELVFFPDVDWSPNTAYSGIARGIDEDLPFRFCTGSSTDDAPPELGRIDEVTSDPVSPRCDALEGGYRIAVFFPPATDFGPPGSIEYLLFQTRGPGVAGPILRDRVRNFPTERVTMAFVLPPDEATSPICVRVAAVDGVGNVDFSDADVSGETCVDPVQGNFFYGLCSASPPRRSTGGSLGLGALALAALALRSRRRR